MRRRRYEVTEMYALIEISNRHAERYEPPPRSGGAGEPVTVTSSCFTVQAAVV